jgi:hypothetical protein
MKIEPTIFTGAAAAAVCALSSGCSHAPGTRVASSVADRPNIALDYELTRQGGDTGVVLEGRTTLDGRESSGVRHSTPHGREELHFDSRARDDGSFDVWMRYEEQSNDWDLNWNPVLHLARGSMAVANVEGPGWVRSLKLKVE